ncbi:GTPase HflX [Thiomicrospira microaerophila]|uniref:ribosome rescue GTPase HflX n=1 Tax=Thiomicrospira microaerophila TaxID=406020 RepID=UPI00200BE184|nr:ribosome rescue GTPase HflX [Thiomicrospira microaerophila]UQB41662.1 GTPase HflX [Thiomicrospira microaerophila]
MELFGRIERKALDTAVLVHVDFDDEANREDLNEFHELVDSAGAQIVALITTKRSSPDAKFFVGSGKAQEIADAVKLYEADVVIVNHALSPGQERNLERLVQCRVIDRVGLILDIFAQRARSHEGKLQVELAQLRHMSTRLVRGWTHLERQKGGIGLRGPGETQLETDRRLLQDRIKQLLKRIDKVRQQRALGRRSRKKSDVPTVTIVGYTNAGKSTLFNQLTTAEVYAEDRLFATLDATLRSIHLPGAGKVILADTVGFIRHIPHDLVAAFRSTLEETSEANLLIHLVDANDPLREEKIIEVQKVIAEVGAQEVPQLLVFNKIDQLDPAVDPKIDCDEHGVPQRVWVSAKLNLGMELLQDALASFFKGQFVKVRVGLPAASGQQRAKLYQLGKVDRETCDDQGQIYINMTLTQQQWQQVQLWPDLLCLERA